MKHVSAMRCSFVRELHQQLVSCMNHFIEELQTYESEQEDRMRSRDETLRRELNDVQQIMSDIDLLMQSREVVEVGGTDMVARCNMFFTGCVDFSNCDDDFSHVDFVQAGRLYVRSEHLGYLRLCNALPEDVTVSLAANTETMCNRECIVLIKTGHTNCVNAEAHLDIQLNDVNSRAVTFSIANKRDGSYNVVFTPEIPGKHRIHVQLFHVSVSGSPLEIDVQREPALPTQTTARPLYDSTHTQPSTGGEIPTIIASSTTAQLATTPPSFSGNFDDSDYFAVAAGPISPHSVVENYNWSNNNAVPSSERSHSSLHCSQPDTVPTKLTAAALSTSSAAFSDTDYVATPRVSAGGAFGRTTMTATASAGNDNWPARQSGRAAAVSGDIQDDWEGVTTSVQQMNIRSAASQADNSAGGDWPFPFTLQTTQTGTGASARCGSVPSYTRGSVLEFEDLAYEESDDFDGSGQKCKFSSFRCPQS